MNIQTKYNIEDEITFYPFNKRSLPPTKSTIILITIRTNKDKKTFIEYTVRDSKRTLWDVCEQDIV